MLLTRRPQTIPALVAAILLLVALGNHPYGYYTFVRWAVSIAAMFLAVFAHKQKRHAITWLFVGVAILFNPIAPVYLQRSTWHVLDVLTALIFIGSLVLVEGKRTAPG